MLFIGICGPSGSGKTTLSEELVRAAGVSSTLIKQDAYYFDFPEVSYEQRARMNYDEPGIFDHDLLLKDVGLLLSGSLLPGSPTTSRVTPAMTARR